MGACRRMGFAYNIRSCSILMAKLWGIHSAMVMAKELGCRHLWVESDSATAHGLYEPGCVTLTPLCFSGYGNPGLVERFFGCTDYTCI